MSPRDRYAWLKAWLSKGGRQSFADILDADLVRAYVAATGVSASETGIGAPRCPQLGRDLSAMFAGGVVRRSRVGLPAGDASMGFPKWVFSYYLAPKDSTHERAAETSGPA